MRAVLRPLSLVLAIPLRWVALAAPRTCGQCLPFKLISWEVGIDQVEMVLENPIGSLMRPASLVELMLDDMIVGKAMLGPVGIGAQVGIIIDYYLPPGADGEVDLKVLADGDLVGMIEVKAAADEAPADERAPAPRT